MPPSTFSPTSESKLGCVADFLRSVFSTPPSSPLTSPEFLRWKYFTPRPDWEQPRSYVLESEGKITGHGAAWPLTLITQAGRHSAFNFIDWAANPGRPGAGVAMLQRMSRLADLLIVVGGSAMARSILPAVGFRPCGTVLLFARPLRPATQLARSWRWNLKAPARVARNTFARLSPPIRPVPGWSLDPVTPSELAGLFEARDQRRGDTARFTRTQAQLEYYLQCPLVSSQLFVLRHGSEDRGYCVITSARRQARIVDSWVPNGSSEEWRALLRMCLLRALESEPICELVTFTSDPAAAAALKASGFLARGSLPVTYLSRAGVDLSNQPILVQMLDCDAAFRASEADAFWT